MQAARADMAEHAKKTSGYHWCQCELNLLGDPTLDLRARDAMTPKLSAPKQITIGEAEVKVTTDAPVGATLCLWKEGEIYQTAKVGSVGEGTFKVSPKTAGKISVTVSGPSLNVTQTNILVK